MPGMWRRYYTRWKDATLENLDPALLELLPRLAKLCPPATVIDKRYSAFAEPKLLARLEADGHRKRLGNGRLRARDCARRSGSRVSRDRRPGRSLQFVQRRT